MSSLSACRVTLESPPPSKGSALAREDGARAHDKTIKKGVASRRCKGNLTLGPLPRLRERPLRSAPTPKGRSRADRDRQLEDAPPWPTAYIRFVGDFYGHGPRALQDRFDTRRLADRIRERLVRDRFSEDDRAFIGRMDMFFLATVDASGQPSCSYKGGAPGFVQVVDDVTLAFPSFDGNGMYLSMGNVMEATKVGLLFIDFESQTRLRVTGDASNDLDDPLLGGCPEAQLIVRVRARAIFPTALDTSTRCSSSSVALHAGLGLYDAGAGLEAASGRPT